MSFKLPRNKENGLKLKHDGYSIVKSVLNNEECIALQSKIDKLIDNKLYDWTDGSDFRIYQAQQYTELATLNKAFKNADKLANLFHGTRYHYTDLIAKITYRQGNKGSGGGGIKILPIHNLNQSFIYQTQLN